MVGAAIWRQLEKAGYTHLLGKTSKELDLRNQDSVHRFFEVEKPEVVIDAAGFDAGRVGNFSQGGSGISMVPEQSSGFEQDALASVCGFGADGGGIRTWLDGHFGC